MKNLRELPKLRDGLSYLYLERTRVEQKHRGIAFFTPDGEVAVPAASLTTLLLGPGSSVTHAAMRTLAENGCGVCWVGEQGVRFYASGVGETRSSRNLLKQASAWAFEASRTAVVRTLYALRFPDPLGDDLTIEQIRGLEGVRVREAYAKASRTSGVPWRGRAYKRGDWRRADPINRALSAGNSCLYGVCHAAIVSLGYSPALGFIHTGKQLSFVYDVADLYKADTIIPIAFAAAAEDEQGLESRVRKTLRDRFRESSLMQRIGRDVASLFDGTDDDPYAEDFAEPGGLWGPDGVAEGGVSYGRDGTGECAKGPEG